jgi:TorA maturation chaperone TorD
VAREDLCRFLAACFYEPAPMFAEARLFDSMRLAAEQVDADLGVRARRLGEAFAKDALQDLLVDYTRLFLGPVQPLAKPYGSFWLSGESTLMQDSTRQVLELYAQAGFDIDDGFHELPDHVAVELEFLYLLAFRQNRARHDADAAALDELLRLEQRFLGQHLGAWFAPFTAAMAAGAQTDFYRELAALTDAFLRLQLARAQPH